MDRRQQKTRAAVFAAFEELVSEKRYEQITVQDIIDRANIGRTTFYANFETKDSLLEEICEDLFTHIFDREPHAEADHDFSRSVNSARDRLTHIMYHLRENQKRYRRLFSGESAELFWSIFRKWFENQLGDVIRERLKEKRIAVPEDLYVNLFVGTYIETIKWWFHNACREDAEVVERYFEEMI